ncbi:MAG: MSCRAMM family protein, partial [Candidatus Acidiferrales bacterium]
MKSQVALSLLLLAGLVSADAAQQPTPTEKPATAGVPLEKCVVSGQVVKAGSGEPLKKARVTLTKEQSQEAPKTEITDSQGRFTFTEVEAGRYRLFAARNGYAPQQYGQRGPNRPGTILALVAGQRVKDVLFKLPPAAVIAGKVYDEDGEAIAGVMVQVLQHRYVQGRRQLAPVGQAATNDRGEYRVFGLEAGRYYVSATFRPGFGGYFFSGAATITRGVGGPAQDESYAPTYYPGTNDPGRANPLELRAGNELTNIDFLLLPTRAVRIRGRVYNAVTGKPGRDVQVTVFDPSSRVRAWFARPSAQVEGPEGKFELRAVVPGSYQLVAFWYDEENNQGYSARLAVNVGDAGLEGVELVIERGVDVWGSVRVEGRTPEAEGSDGDAEDRKLDLTELRVALEPREEDLPNFGSGAGVIKENGSFMVQNAMRVANRVTVWGRGGLPGNHYLKSVRVDGNEVLEEGLDLSAGPPQGPLEL